MQMGKAQFEGDDPQEDEKHASQLSWSLFWVISLKGSHCSPWWPSKLCEKNMIFRKFNGQAAGRNLPQMLGHEPPGDAQGIP